MALSDNAEAIAKMRYWCTQARESVIWYEHKDYGYNYRMSNVCAAIGRGQLEVIDAKLKRRGEIHRRYMEDLSGLPLRIKESMQPGSNCWLSLMYIEDDNLSPTKVVSSLQNTQIESRPAWKPMHMQPVFGGAKCFSYKDGVFDDTAVFDHTVCLPSGDSMTEEEQTLVIEEVKASFALHRSIISMAEYSESRSGVFAAKFNQPSDAISF